MLKTSRKIKVKKRGLPLKKEKGLPSKKGVDYCRKSGTTIAQCLIV
jgi:hypothetical protein